MTRSWFHLPTANIRRGQFSWILVSVIAGLLVGFQPIPVVVIFSSLIAFLALAAFTPVVSLIALLVLAPMRVLITTEMKFALPLDIGQLLLVGALLSYVVYCVARGKRIVEWQKSKSPIFVPLVIFLVVTALSAFQAFSLTAWLPEWLKWIQLTLMVLLVLQVSRFANWRWLIFGLVLAADANAVVGIYEFFGGSGALHLLINNRFFRAFGTFGQPNPFGGFMGLVAPIAFVCVVGCGMRVWKKYRVDRVWSGSLLVQGIYYLLSLGLMLIAIGMSWSRGAWLGLAGAFLVIILAIPRVSWRGIGLFVVLVVTFAGLWTAGVLPASIVDRISSSTQEFFAFEDVRGVDITPDNFAVVERLAHWQVALNMFNEHPWLGVGFGNYEVVYPFYRLINWLEPLGHAHNYYLNILAEVGVLGLLGYGKVWLSIILMTWRTRRHPDDFSRLASIGLLGSWTYLLIHSLFDDLFVNNLFIHLGLMLGILALLYNQACSYHKLEIA